MNYRNKKHYVVAVTGGSGSGKSHFITQLLERIGPEKAAILSMDNYYKPLSEQPRDMFGEPNFDRPESVNLKRLGNDLEKLMEGESIITKLYTYNNDSLQAPILEIEPKPLIFLDGIFLLQDEKVNRLADLKVYMDAPDAVKLERRIKRDREERGYDEADVRYKFEHHVLPSQEEFIQPTSESADLIVPSNQDISKVIDMLSKSLLEIHAELMGIHY